MKRVQRRVLIRRLTGGTAPPAPDGLAKRIQAEIPEELYPRSGGSEDDSGEPNAGRDRSRVRLWQVAAAVFLVATSGFIAVEFWRPRPQLVLPPAAEPGVVGLEGAALEDSVLEDAVLKNEALESGTPAARGQIAPRVEQPRPAQRLEEPVGEAVGEIERAQKSEGDAARVGAASSTRAPALARASMAEAKRQRADSRVPAEEAFEESFQAETTTAELVAVQSRLKAVSTDALSEAEESSGARRLVVDDVERVDGRLLVRGRARPGTRLEVGEMALEVGSDGTFELDLPWPTDGEPPEIRVIGPDGDETVEATPLPEQGS